MQALAEIEPLKSLKIQDEVNSRIEAVEAKMLKLPQVECPLQHTFAPGVYVRTITMPAGSFIIGHCHKTKHAQVVSTGSALVSMDGVVHRVDAPCTLVSDAGVRKCLYIISDMTWTTIHPTDETDLGKLEDLLIEKSQSFLDHQRELAQLQEHVQRELTA